MLSYQRICAQETRLGPRKVARQLNKGTDLVQSAGVGDHVGGEADLYWLFCCVYLVSRRSIQLRAVRTADGLPGS